MKVLYLSAFNKTIKNLKTELRAIKSGNNCNKVNVSAKKTTYKLYERKYIFFISGAFKNPEDIILTFFDVFKTPFQSMQASEKRPISFG